MQFTFEKRDQSVVVKEVTPSSSMTFEIPVAPEVVLDGLKTLLVDPQLQNHTMDGVNFDRLRDGLRLTKGSLTYTFRYMHLFPMVMDT